MSTYGGKGKVSVVSLFIIIIAAIIAFATPHRKQETIDGLRVFFIDVGQGDCSLICTGEQTLLIDGGEYECWEEDIQPFMLENGYKKFSNVMISHYHSDHGGGIHELTEAGKAERLIMPNTPDTGSLKNKLTRLAKQTDTEIVPISAGDRVDFGHPDVKLEVLFPDRDIYENEDENLNNDSIILRLDYFDTSFLFTGDLEEDAEQVLLNSGKLDADVLKVGHHGSKTSTSAEFLEAVDPDYAVIGVGENNSYGHPHDSVTKRLKNHGTMIYRTDRNGDILFEVNEKGISRIETEYR